MVLHGPGFTIICLGSLGVTELCGTLPAWCECESGKPLSLNFSGFGRQDFCWHLADFAGNTKPKARSLIFFASMKRKRPC